MISLASPHPMGYTRGTTPANPQHGYPPMAWTPNTSMAFSGTATNSVHSLASGTISSKMVVANICNIDCFIAFGGSDVVADPATSIRLSAGTSVTFNRGSLNATHIAVITRVNAVSLRIDFGSGTYQASAPETMRPEDGATVDAFGRFRVSTPATVFESKNVHGADGGAMDTELTGSGTAVFKPDESAVDLTVTTASGDIVLRRSDEWVPYRPGKSQHIIQTAVFAAGQANNTQQVGYFDDENGVFFQMKDTVFQIVLRSGVTGSVVDTEIAQADWNIDPMDGSGVSGIILDHTKLNIYTIDLQWLGAGSIRYGIQIGRVTHIFHEISNANKNTTTYMGRGSLPVTFRIENTDTVASGAILKEVCATVQSEGGTSEFGVEFSGGNGVTTIGSLTARRPLCAIRPKTTLNGVTNRRKIQLRELDLYAATQDCFFEVVHAHNPTTVTGDFISVNAESAVEISVNVSEVSGGVSHTIKSRKLSATNQSAGTVGMSTEDLVGRHNFIHLENNGTDQEYFVVFATPFAGTNGIASADIAWIEIE